MRRETGLLQVLPPLRRSIGMATAAHRSAIPTMHRMRLLDVQQSGRGHRSSNHQKQQSAHATASEGTTKGFLGFPRRFRRRLRNAEARRHTRSTRGNGPDIQATTTHRRVRQRPISVSQQKGPLHSRRLSRNCIRTSGTHRGSQCIHVEFAWFRPTDGVSISEEVSS